ncbi:MAG TPA: hypothetical protein PK778_01975 [Bacillota bacterium]|nr:hypothetical protein [Clostridiales bacterium]HPT84748.1 hypothetical protein [Bacillota bacterium]
MLKKTRFYIGLTLIVQSLTFIALSVVLFFKNKKNYAGLMLGFGTASGIAGAAMIYKQLKRVIEDDRILEAMDELLEEEENSRPYYRREVPVDDTASEEEFTENV